jgi:drug/metabolite transporter (DMT)-like permease
MSERPSTTALIILLIFAMIGWGGSWTSGKVASQLVRPEIIIFWRFLLTVLSMVPLMVIQRKSMKIEIKTLILLLCASALLIAYNMFFLWGVRIGYAGAGGVLVTTLNPVMTLGWASIFFRKRPRTLQIVGLVLGFLGGAVILNLWHISYKDLLDSGNIFFLLAPLSWSLLTILSQRIQEKVTYMVFSFYVFAFATVLSLPLALMYGMWPVTDQYLILWANIAFLAIVATSFGATVYFLASGRLGSQRASSFTFLIPVFAVLFSWLVLDETPVLTTIIGGALSIAAVQLINMKQPSKKHAEK